MMTLINCLGFQRAVILFTGSGSGSEACTNRGSLCFIVENKQPNKVVLVFLLFTEALILTETSRTTSMA